MNRQNYEDSYPLSPVQQGMLFHDLYAPHSGMYLQQLVCVLREKLNVKAFKEAWRGVIARHPVLRTSFHWQGLDEPVQKVHKYYDLPWTEKDCRAMSLNEQNHRIEIHLREDRRRSFELTEAPLMRLALFQMGDADYRFIWTSHHAIMDGRSRFIVLKELFSLYEAFCIGKDIQLERPRPYKDYIDWLLKEDFNKAEAFWRRMLEGVTTHTPLMVDRISHGSSDKDGKGYEKLETRLSDKLTRALMSLSRQHGLTPNALLQGAWAQLLSRYGGEQDVVFGAPRACRRSGLKGTESMVGLFINTLPIRIHVPSNGQLLPWLKEIRSKWIEVRDYEHTPIVKVQEWSRIPAGKPLFESILSFENYDLTSAVQAEGGKWLNRAFKLIGFTNYPIAVTGYLESKLLLEIVYDSSRFEDGTISRMLGHIETLLQGMAENPYQRLSDVPMLTDQERKQLLTDWNDTATGYPRDSCVHHLFEQQAAQTPEAVALVYEDKELTYRELNARSNQLAHYLKAFGVGPEDLVGICFERSLETVIALTAVLKAGGAYVPLDPAYPKERLNFMLRDTQAVMLLTQENLLKTLPETEAPVVCVDTDWDTIQKESRENPDAAAVAENLAYVMYTSGSTGMPKGVSISHRSVVRLVKESNYAEFGPEEVYLQFSPISFDASTFEIWAALLNGSRLVMFPAYMPSLDELGRAVEKYKVTALWLTSGLFHLMVEDQIDSLQNVRQLLAGGDVLSAAHVQKVCRQLNDCQFINGYGPTENTTFTCCFPVSDMKQIEDTVPIGRPISNTEVYILDPNLRHVPVGVPGQLYIGGDGLSRQYLNRPELTAQAFIPNPFSNRPGDRLYQTGDLVRYLPDGNIEFLGRMDHQVKIRGFRIELGEIEAVLNQHPKVSGAVVLAAEDPMLGKSLIAYVVADLEMTNESNELRNFLKQKLPDYMVPNAYVYLDALPLTPNGKVDRRALNKIDASRPARENRFAAPETPVEKYLAGIWEKFLGIHEIGINDNFFDLGGHSLLATRVISHVSDIFQVELPLRCFFDAPTVAGLTEALGKYEAAPGQVLATARILRKIDAMDAEEIRAVLREKKKTRETPALSAGKRTDALPLSFAQQRLWFLDQLEPGRSIYNIPAACRLLGPLNVKALEQGLNEIVRRHEALRTAFTTVDDQPVQEISPALTLTVQTVDLQGSPAAGRETEVRRLAAEEARRPFDLSKGPLLRARLLRLHEQDHVFLLTIHHIVSDGWSMDVLFRELSVLYEAFSKGKPSPLPELPVQYADFAVWQRQRLQGEVLETQLAYWRQQLEGAPPVLELPTDRPRPTVQSFRGAKRSLVVPEGLSEALNALSRREGVTLFMTLLAAFKILLHRYTGQDEIVLGSPMAGRNRSEIEGLIGFFVNTLVLRTDLSGNPAFPDLLRRVREVCLGAYAHQDIPFEKLVEELNPDRNLHHNPLFQVLFNMVPVEASGLELLGLKTEPVRTAEPDSKFDLTLYVKEDKSNIRIELVYNADLFGQDRMREMLNQFKHLLLQIAENPEKSIASYSLITPESVHLLPDPGIVLSEPGQELTMNMFSYWVERTPEREAVRQGGQTRTYAELAECAGMLARELTARGVEKGEVIAVCGPRSFGLIAGMLGVLLNGGVMLPIDPGLPDQRKKQMLREASAKRVVYAGRRRSEDIRLTQSAGLDSLWVDPETARAVDDDKRADLAAIHLPQVSPDDPAYIFFTSGTTGVPKGILGCHKGLSHFLHWQGETFDIGAQDRVAQLTNLSFDVVLRDIFLPLTRGATLCLPEEKDILEPEDILNWLQKEQVSVLHIVPALAQSWLGEIPEGVSLDSLRWVFFAGEPLNDILVSRWRDAFPSAEMTNLYGATETTMAKCFYRVQSDVFPGVQPLGRPMPETQVLIMAHKDRLCGIGEIGEIVIRTPFRSLGYINAPEENRQRFVKNPFRDDERDLFYYTGDLGRRRPDGMLEILGRLDDQVKISGVRIEPDEVTAALSGHPAVKACAVVAGGDEQGRTCLAAYVVTQGQASISPAELMSYLSRLLPTAMVPARYVFLDALPMTPNGKVDRRALPVPDTIPRKNEKTVVAPRDNIELQLVRIWEDILDVRPIGVTDNFFELGGHSLLATRVISQIRKNLHVELPLRGLFEAPTVAGLSKRIHTPHQTPEDLPVPRPALGDGDLPLSFAQQRLWFLDQLEPGRSIYNIPAAYRIRGPLHVKALEQGIHEIVRRHEVLRTAFTTSHDLPVQVISPVPPLTLQVAELRDFPAAGRMGEVRRLAAEEARRPFDLSKGPLLRAGLLRINEEDHVLLLTMHHIVFDGWSIDILLRELSVLYEAFSLGKSSPLPEPPIQYADFALWQRRRLQGEVLETQLSYWRHQLDGMPAVLELPADRPRPAVQSFRGARRSLVISKAVSEELKALSRSEGATLFMTLLAAFKVLLHRYTGQEDIVIGSPIANRNRSEIEGLIGFFVNTLVLRTDLSGDPSFRELLIRVRETACGAYDHQDIPFEKLVEALHPERDLSRNPLFQVMFTLQNVPKKAPELSGLSITPMKVDTETAKFDLSLVLWETPAGIRGVLEYSTDLFDKDTAGRMIGHFGALLGGIVTGPDQRISRLPVLTKPERKRLLSEWNAARSEFLKDSCFQELFEGQVDRTPDAVAAVCENEKITYRQLNERSNQLAHYLKKLGVGPLVIVGILMERSVRMIIALLGILKAGGAFLPLDAAHPKQRLAFMVEDSRMTLILTQQSMMSKIPAEGLRVCLLDTESRDILKMPQENPICVATAEDLAYVIYTSGSTGKPKGAMIPHRALVNYLTWCIKTYPVAKGGSIPVFSSLAFDITFTGLFAPLLTGQKVLLVPEAVGIEDIGEALSDQKDFGLIKVTPVQLKLLSCQVSDVDAVKLTKALVIGGEALLPEHIDFWRQTAPNTILFNEYGPTETVVGCCVYQIPNGIEFQGSIPIGRPIANTQLLILDNHFQPVPIGVQGELYIGGDGLAWGYIHRPDLTAERFVPNPFHDNPGGRLYKTGDLVRRLSGGNIEFIGRIDNQVQIRGYRIELGEIEAVLAQHPVVRESVVIAREDEPGEKRLVAYVVIKKKTKAVIKQLRLYLKEKLPDYMVPSIFIFLDTLPLTINGKVDRRALPAPDKTRRYLESDFVPPRTNMEKILADIFEKVLKVEKIGVQDNFFELGGDSILGLQVITRANQAGLGLTLKQLFQHQTISGLVSEAGTAPSIRAEQGPVKGPVPVTPIQHWFFEQDFSDPHHWNMAVLLEARPSLEPPLLARAVEHLVRHHDALRLRFLPKEGGRQQAMVTSEVNSVFSCTDLTNLPKSEHGPVVESQAAKLQASLNLSAGPLLRVGLFDGGADHSSRLLIVIHHLAMDGVSWRILLEDLQLAYQQLSRREKVQLPPKTTSFQAWAKRLTDAARSGMFQPELEYWLEACRSETPSLPVDYPGGANTEASARTVSGSLTAEETRALLLEVPGAYRTQINDVLLTALLQAFSRWTGARSMTVDLEGHGREGILENVDLSRTVGWFTTIFPVFLELVGTSDPGRALKSVKEQLRRIPNRGIGYGVLRYLSAGTACGRRLRALPQAEVSFNYLGRFDQVLSETALFRWGRESRGPSRSPNGLRSHLLAINGVVRGNRLRMDWTYSGNFHRGKTIERLAQDFMEALRSLITHCVSPTAGGFTPSDFPEAGLSQEDLDSLITELHEPAPEDLHDQTEY